MFDPKAIAEIYGVYSNRISQLETWRHLVVVFAYTAIAVCAGPFIDPSQKGFVAAMGVLCCTKEFMYLCLFLVSFVGVFSSWSQYRVISLANCLDGLQRCPGFPTPGTYYCNGLSRAIIYTVFTNLALAFQIVFVAIVCMWSTDGIVNPDYSRNATADCHGCQWVRPA